MYFEMSVAEIIFTVNLWTVKASDRKYMNLNINTEELKNPGIIVMYFSVLRNNIKIKIFILVKDC